MKYQNFKNVKLFAKKSLKILAIIILAIIAIIVLCAIFVVITMKSREFPQKQTNYEAFSKDLETGDLLLYQTYEVSTEMVSYFTPCTYTHISIILKRPTWLDPTLTDDYYILESVIDNIKGDISHSASKDIKVVSLHYVYDNYTMNQLGHLYVRKLHAEIPIHKIHERVKKAHDVIKNDTYDTNADDWTNALTKMDSKVSSLNLVYQYHNRKTMWCSALVAYVYKECGFLSPNIPWTIINPCDFGAHTDKQNLKFINCTLDDEELRL